MKKTKRSHPLKRIIIAAAVIATAALPAFSQNGVGINSAGSPADPSSMLDVSSTAKGALMPRMTASDRTSIVSPAIGLTVYQTDAPEGYYYNSSTGWIKLSISTGTVTGVTASSPISSSGGAAPNISLTGTVGVANGGTGTGSTLSGYVKGGNPMTAVAAIPGADITGNISGNAANVTGVVGAANGGTGQSSYAIGDIVYASGATTLSKLADVATGNALISGGVGVIPSYGKIGLATHVSGTLPVANGGTNSSAAPTAGGVDYGTGTAHAFTAAGTAGQVLTSAGAGTPTWSALGQSITSVYSTAAVTISTAGTSAAVTGLSQTFTVPAGYVALISSYGGLSNSGGSASSAGCIADVYLLVDGGFPANGPYARYLVGNNFYAGITFWAFDTKAVVAAGTHTATVNVYLSAKGGSVTAPTSLSAGGAAGSVTQGELTVTIIKL